jgi:hypothetical protein
MEEAADDGPDRKAVTRLCAVTREVRPISELIRFVAAPDGRVVADIRNRLPGRGVWIRNSAACLKQAIRRKVLVRGLKIEGAVSADMVVETADLLRRDALQFLSLANKAGAVTSGFAKIEGMRGRILALVQADDGSPSEIARLQGLCRGRGPRGADPATIGAFKATEIGLSIGREHVIHAALAVHDASVVFVERARRFVEFMSDGPAERENAPASGPSGFADPLPESAPLLTEEDDAGEAESRSA